MASQKHFDEELKKHIRLDLVLPEPRNAYGKCLNRFADFNDSVELFRHGGFGSVDEFSKLASDANQEHVQNMKKLMRIVLSAHNPEEKFHDSDYYSFIQRLFRDDKLDELRSDITVITYNYDCPKAPSATERHTAALRPACRSIPATKFRHCKSLTAVALPRRETTKNFVLQTTCRCLREVVSAKDETALIALGEGNYETLDKELKENYALSIADLRIHAEQAVNVLVRKPKLGNPVGTFQGADKRIKFPAVHCNARFRTGCRTFSTHSWSRLFEHF
jgi:hypothetical protein